MPAWHPSGSSGRVARWIVAPPEGLAWRLGAALGAVALAGAANYAFESTLGPAAPFLLYYPAIIAAGLFGGLGAGLMSVALSLLAILTLNVAPAPAFKLPSAQDVVRLGLFGAFGSGLTWLNFLLRHALTSSHERESRFQRMVVNIRDYSIIMLDPEGRILTWNEGVRQLKGYEPEEVLGRHFSMFYPSRDRAHTAEELRIAAEAGRYEEEGWRVRKDGQRFWAGVVITALRDDRGRLLGFAKVVRDLTERRRHEQALRESRESLRRHAELLEKAVAELEAFSHAVSHNLRAPLRAVQGYASLVIERAANCLDPESQRLLRRVGEAALRMDRLIKDLLAYDRVRRSEPVVSDLELDSLVAHVVEDYSLSDRSRIRVRRPLARVRGNPSMMTQALSNLVENAVKFADPKRPSSVEIWTEQVDGKERVVVADNGRGIPSERLVHIFEPFIQGGEVSGEGTGIGLAIVKSAVERMGGKVGVESETGRGSRFWIELPRA